MLFAAASATAKSISVPVKGVPAGSRVSAYPFLNYFGYSYIDIDLAYSAPTGSNGTYAFKDVVGLDFPFRIGLVAYDATGVATTDLAFTSATSPIGKAVTKAKMIALKRLGTVKAGTAKLVTAVYDDDPEVSLRASGWKPNLVEQSLVASASVLWYANGAPNSSLTDDWYLDAVVPGLSGTTVKAMLTAALGGKTAAKTTASLTVPTGAAWVESGAKIVYLDNTHLAVVGQAWTSGPVDSVLRTTGITVGTPAVKYQWYRNGVKAKGRTAQTYPITAADQNATIQVTVTPTGTGNILGSTIYPSALRGSFLLARAATISGTPKVGETLAFEPTPYSGAPIFTRQTENGLYGSLDDPFDTTAGALLEAYYDGLATTYATTQWYRGTTKHGKTGYTAIPSATTASYAPTAADAGHPLKIVWSLHGLLAPFTVSATTPAIAKGAITGGGLNQSYDPTTRTFTATPTTPSSPTGVTQHLQWYRNGKAVKGRTGASYAVGSADRNATLSVKASWSKAGYATTSATANAGSVTLRFPTAPLNVIYPAALPATAPHVGDAVCVYVFQQPETTAGANPGSPTLTYQWYRSTTKKGKTTWAAIPGATSFAYALTASDKGRTVRARVTGALSGYFSAVVTTNASGKVLP